MRSGNKRKSGGLRMHQRENERKGKATLAELNARLDRLKEGDTPEEIRLKELQKTKVPPNTTDKPY